MKVTMEFDLPADQDALLDAVNATRWREFAQFAECSVARQVEAAKTPEGREAFSRLFTALREVRRETGLSFWTSKTWEDAYNRFRDDFREVHKGPEKTDA